MVEGIVSSILIVVRGRCCILCRYMMSKGSTKSMSSALIMMVDSSRWFLCGRLC